MRSVARHPVFIALALALVTAGVFWPVQGFEFVNYDDPTYVTENPQVQAGLSSRGIQWAFTTGHGSNWHPLTWLSLMLDVELFGPGPAAAHLVNLFLHVASMLVLFVALREMTGTHWRSAMVAALFGLHPLHVESVAWVAERKDVLSALFGFLTLWTYGRWSRADRRCAGWRWYGLALLFFTLGLMSKAMLVTLPCVLLLLDVWPLRRVEWVGGRLPGILRLIVEKVPFFALAAASSVITFLVQQKGGSVNTLSHLSLAGRIENALVSYARYLWKTVWPTDLAVFYPRPEHWPLSAVVGAAGLLLVLTWAAWLWRRKLPFATIGWLWFAGMMVPVIGLVQVGDQAMADRYTYLPLVGLFIAVVWGVTHSVERWRVPVSTAGAAGVAVLIGCAVQTRVQLSYWRNTETLLGHAIAVTENNHLAHYNLGNALLARGAVEEAAGHFENAARMRPGFPEAHNNLALALRRSGRLDESEQQFRTALDLSPRLAIAHNGLANLLLQRGRADEAIAHYRQALDSQPALAESHYNLGIALTHTGRTEEAIGHFRRAAELRPDLEPAARAQIEQINRR